MAVFNVFNPLQNVTPRFTEHQLSDIIEWFDNNSKPFLTDEGVTVNVMRDFYRYHKRSFHYPSYGEIMTEIEKLKAGTTRMITKDQFICMLDKWVLMPDIKNELKLAFKVFDTEKRNFLEIDDIVVIVTNYADEFIEDETRELLRDANVRGDGNVFYEDFVESLFSVAPELHELKVEYLHENPDEDPTFLPEPVIEDVPPTPPTTQPEIKQPTKKEKKK